MGLKNSWFRLCVSELKRFKLGNGKPEKRRDYFPFEVGNPPSSFLLLYPQKTRSECETLKMTSDDDDRCLGSMIKDRKKKSTPNSNGNTAAIAKAKVKKDEQKLDNGADNPKPKPTKPIVKKEEKHNESDDDDEKPIARSKPKKALVKKEDKDNESDDDKPIAKKSSNSKPDKNGKRKREEAAIPEKKKREKKVYDLPGQKRDPPTERDPLRIFYETLYEQLPDSEMAQAWLMESGLLSKEEAKRVFEKKQKSRQLQKISSPSKAVTSVKKTTTVTTQSKGGASVTKTTTSVTVKKKTAATSSSKKKPTTASKGASKDDESSENGSDDDFMISQRPKKNRAA